MSALDRVLQIFGVQRAEKPPRGALSEKGVSGTISWSGIFSDENIDR